MLPLADRHIKPSVTTETPNTADQLRQFAEAVYEPGDIVEVRRISVYGMAVGVLYQVAWTATGGRVRAVCENEWIHGETKASRQRMVAAEFQQYRDEIARDTGGDMADAIALAQWHFSHKVAVPA